MVSHNVPPNGQSIGAGRAHVNKSLPNRTVTERVEVPVAFTEGRDCCVSAVDLSVIDVDINRYVRGVEVVEQIDDVIDRGAEPCRSVVIVCAGDNNDVHGRSSSRAVDQFF